MLHVALLAFSVLASTELGMPINQKKNTKPTGKIKPPNFADGTCAEQSALLDWGNLYGARGGVPDKACAVTLVMSQHTFSAGCGGGGCIDSCADTVGLGSNSHYNFYVGMLYTTGRPDVATQNDFNTWMQTAVAMAGNSTDTEVYSEKITSLLTTYLRSDQFSLWIDGDPALMAAVNPTAGAGCLFWQGKSQGALSVVAFATLSNTTPVAAAH